MSAAAGLSATAGEGQKLWTTLLLGLTDIILSINIWGHARDQTKAAQAKADSRAVRKQVSFGGQITNVLKSVGAAYGSGGGSSHSLSHSQTGSIEFDSFALSASLCAFLWGRKCARQRLCRGADKGSAQAKADSKPVCKCPGFT